MTTKPTCETCLAWDKTVHRSEDSSGLGICRLTNASPTNFKDSSERCMQHIPIEAECEHEFLSCGDQVGFECIKCGFRKPTVTMSEDRFHELEERAECEHIFARDARPDSPVGSCVRCGAQVKWKAHTDDHSLEANLKDTESTGNRILDLRNLVEALDTRLGWAQKHNKELYDRIHIADAKLKDAQEKLGKANP